MAAKLSDSDSASDGGDTRPRKSQFVFGKVLSTDPVITISKTGNNAPMGLVGCCPEAFEGRAGLHLLGLTWSAEREGRAEEIKQLLADLQRQHPESHFVMLASSEVESFLLSSRGVPTLLANELLFVDERAYRPLPVNPHASVYDAVYNARISPYKRHLLAADVRKLLLVYGYTSAQDAAHLEEVREKLSHAEFLNHRKGNGNYVSLNPQDVCAAINQARVGLCLSEAEGAMRASIEYALCGLPIVTTRSVGGRDRFFLGPHVEIVDDTAEAVAQGVERMLSQVFDKMAIRNHVAHMLAFERHNFLLNLNKLVRLTVGVDGFFSTFEPFVGVPLSQGRLRPALGPLAPPDMEE